METPTLALLPNNKSKFNPQIAWASLLPGSGSCTNCPSTLSGISWPHKKRGPMAVTEGEINAGMGRGVGWWDGAAGLPLDVFLPGPFSWMLWKEVIIHSACQDGSS